MNKTKNLVRLTITLAVVATLSGLTSQLFGGQIDNLFIGVASICALLALISFIGMVIAMVINSTKNN
jgi:hypothetical protein